MDLRSRLFSASDFLVSKPNWRPLWKSRVWRPGRAEYAFCHGTSRVPQESGFFQEGLHAAGDGGENFFENELVKLFERNFGLVPVAEPIAERDLDDLAELGRGRLAGQAGAHHAFRTERDFQIAVIELLGHLLD